MDARQVHMHFCVLNWYQTIRLTVARQRAYGRQECSACWPGSKPWDTLNPKETQGMVSFICNIVTAALQMPKAALSDSMLSTVQQVFWFMVLPCHATSG